MLIKKLAEIGTFVSDFKSLVQQIQQKGEAIFLFRLEKDKFLVARYGEQGVCAAK